MGVSESAPPSRSRVYWLRPNLPRRIGADRGLLFAFVVGKEVGVGVSAFDFVVGGFVLRCLEGEREGVGGGESI